MPVNIAIMIIRLDIFNGRALYFDSRKYYGKLQIKSDIKYVDIFYPGNAGRTTIN